MKIAIRADSSPMIGVGHAMRCIALACKLQDVGHELSFVVASITGSVRQLLDRHGFPVSEIDGIANGSGSVTTDAKETVATIRSRSGSVDWVIVDHYQLDIQWELSVKEACQHLMVIDDLADRNHSCDLLLDTGYCDRFDQRYNQRVACGTLRLLGPRYAILRSEFCESRTIRIASDRVKRIFVSYGGTDPTGETQKALDVAGRLPDTTFDVVVGNQIDDLDPIVDTAASLSNVNLHIQPSRIAELLSEADLAIGAGGTSTWERLCCGVPTIATTVADNQVPSISKLAIDGMLRWIGMSDSVSADIVFDQVTSLMRDQTCRAKMLASGQQLVDGRGVERIVRSLESFRCPLVIRRANETDCRLYYQWASDPLVRQRSFNSNEINFTDHQEWFKNRLSDSACQLFVGEIEGVPYGQVRFQESAGVFTLGYSVATEFRGRKLAPQLLRTSLECLQSDQEVTIAGETQLANVASVDALIGVGFHETAADRTDKRRFVLTLPGANPATL